MARKQKQAPQGWRNRIVGSGTVAASQLLANPANWRVHPKAQQDALSGALDQIGWIQDVIVNQTSGHIVDGHLRVTLALRQGDDTPVPVKYVELTDAEERLALATIDPLSAMAATDKEQLDALLRDVAPDSPAVAEMLADVAKEAGLYGDKQNVDAEPQIDRAEELRAKWGVESGQLWQLGEHRLICGDCTDPAVVARVMGGEKADCVFTSPPYAVGVDYGETYQDTIDNLRAMLPKLSKSWMAIVMDGGFAVVNFGDIVSAADIVGTDGPCEYPMALEYWPVFRADGWVLWSRRVWCKPGAGTGSMQCISSNRAATNWEHLWTWRKSGPPMFTKQTTGEYPSQNGWIDSTKSEGLEFGLNVHGAGMPPLPAMYSIANHSRSGKQVFEPFSGTGTTLVSCESLNRKCRAVEISPAYVAVALERWASATGKTPVKL